MSCKFPDEKTRDEYIGRVIDIYAENDTMLTVEEAAKEAERLYQLENSDILGEYKRFREDKEFFNNNN